MPLPRWLANIGRGISEKKRTEARRWAGSRTSKQKYRLPEAHKPDAMVAGSTKRLASRFYQLKAGHCRTGQYLHWAKDRPDPQSWWCQRGSQTREHLFKGCPKWKGEQKILWAEVRKETGRGESRWMIRDLFADRRCSQPVFPHFYRCGENSAGWEEDARSEASEWELRERMEREEERRAEAEALGAEDETGTGEEPPLFLPTPSFMASAGEE